MFRIRARRAVCLLAFPDGARVMKGRSPFWLKNHDVDDDFVCSLTSVMVEGPSTVSSHFRDMAVRLGMKETEFILLEYSGISCMNDFFYKVPTPEKLEDFLKDEVTWYSGVYNTTSGKEEPDWQPRYYTGDYRSEAEILRGDEARVMRQLWEVSRSAAKKDVLALTEDKTDDLKAKKLSLPVARLFMDRSRQLGLDTLDANAYPGPNCLLRFSQNYSTGRIPQYISWELYTSREEEDTADRLGLSDKTTRYKPDAADGSFKQVSEGKELRKIRVFDVTTMLEALLVRRHSAAITNVGGDSQYEELSSVYAKALRGTVPKRMRRPTLGEIRQFDREVHLDIYRVMIKDSQASLAEGLQWYLDNRQHTTWKLMDPQPDGYPDQSEEGDADVQGTSKKREYAEVDIGLDKNAEKAKEPIEEPKAVTRCYVCNKTRKEHKNGRFCVPGSAKGESKGKLKSKDRGKLKKSAEVPSWMKGAATRLPPTPQHPNGHVVCWNHHQPNGQGCSDERCTKSHACPKFLHNGNLCGGSHKLHECPNS